MRFTPEQLVAVLEGATRDLRTEAEKLEPREQAITHIQANAYQRCADLIREHLCQF